MDCLLRHNEEILIFSSKRGEKLYAPISQAGQIATTIHRGANEARNIKLTLQSAIRQMRWQEGKLGCEYNTTDKKAGTTKPPQNKLF